MNQELRSPRAELFWQIQNLPRWEQVTFAALNLPFSLSTSLLGFVLFIPFRLMIILRLPFLIFILAGTAIWCLCLGVLIPLSIFTELFPIFRPITFVLALPFMLIAHNINGVTPAPTAGDMEAKVRKWDLIEAFPYTWSLFRFSVGPNSGE